MRYDVSDMMASGKYKKLKQMALRVSEEDKAAYELFAAERGYDTPSDWLRQLAESDFEQGDSLAAADIKNAMFAKLMGTDDPLGVLADFLDIRKDQARRRYGREIEHLGTLRDRQKKRQIS